MARSSPSLFALLLAACGGSASVVEPPPPPSDTFTLTLQPAPEDQASGQALGWAAGIPAAGVTLTLKGTTPGVPQSFTSSATGTVTIAKLTAGDYVVEARRWLTDAERAKLPAGDDAVGFVAKAYLTVAAGGGQATIPVPASRRHGLLISEFFNNVGYPTGVGEPYFYDAFVELYNNSDTIIYLDGLLLARGFARAIGSPDFPCTRYYPFSRDPGGVWVRWIAKFPGTGRDHPVPPGGIVLIATDAIDHRPIVPTGLDLRGAQFEMIGYDDVDNPAVPNMIDITVGGPTEDHGIFWPDNSPVTVLSMPVDIGALPTGQVLDGGYVYLRFPGDKVLDVLSFHTTYVSANQECPNLIDFKFDRAMASLYQGDEFTLSGQRRVAVVLPGGRKVLQYTRSSDADFTAALWSPGVLPE